MTSLLDTDGYKFSMAEAGFPLRRETFYLSFRRKGPFFLPFDMDAYIRALLNDVTPKKSDSRVRELEYLAENGYRLGGAAVAALSNIADVQIKAIPKGSWFFDREPIVTVTGPSALMSWLEPLLLQTHYRIQVATLALLQPERLATEVGSVTCVEQKEIVLETLDAVKVAAPPIKVDTDLYKRFVANRMRKLVKIVENPARIFEVGMRSVTCPAQHHHALEAAFSQGLRATSNVGAARWIGLRPVGTMGHEHIQRYGSDEAAFRAMRDRFAGSSSFLLDTFSTIDSGIPTAFQLIKEDPSRRDTIRFDSGDKKSQYLYAHLKGKAMGINPRYILEDSFDAALTQEFEELRRFTGVAPEDQLYGYGGYLVKAPECSLTRDRVAAVYKLTQTGATPTMKFGDEPGHGKESIPGRPLLYRPYIGSANHNGGPVGVVVQEGEEPPPNHVLVSGAETRPHQLALSTAEIRGLKTHPRPAYSPETQALVDKLYAARARRIGG